MINRKEQLKKQINPFSEMEKEVLDFWEKNNIFEKSVKNPPNSPFAKATEDKPPLLKRGVKNAHFAKGGNDNKDYVFYDGPPFATGTPHYGHIVGSVMKDVVPRYWTMNGYKVERRWGWDCHGLPIENIVEKEMGSKSKKDIEALGVDEFNAKCCSKVLGYVEDWKKVITRLGRWADMDNAYKTMDLDYMESVWWVFKQLYDKGLIYEGYRSMHICPRCETTLSQQEVTEGYKDIKDLSATVKFKLESDQKIGSFITDENTFILAWTTTPWTLPGNMALAVGDKINYVLIELKTQNAKFKTTAQNSKFIIAKERLEIINFEYEILKEFNGKDLVNLELKYKPLFPYLEVLLAEKRIISVFQKIKTGGNLDYLDDVKLINEIINNIVKEKFFKIYFANFVTTDEGTGVVHIAPAFGEDDLRLAIKEKFEVMIQHVTADGRFKAYVGPDSYADEHKNKKDIEEWRDVVKDVDESKKRKYFIGKEVKPINAHMKTDIEIIRYLAHNNLLFHKEKYEHSYPHCWRCDTPLINYATSSWFVGITKIKNKLLETAKDINWSPAHMKEGRFGKWLEGARDWSISRQRFWASVIPIWKCEKCDKIKVYGSIKDLEKDSGKEVKDLHKHVVDKIKVPCKCGGEMARVPDVLDCWFESGSMPYAQMHYPFENKEKFEKNFPAEFIAEGVDQTRAWFYYLHAIAGGIKDSRAFKNVIVNGTVLAEDGKKMAKKLQNYPDPMLVFDKYGADALRYYLLSSPVMLAENMNFSEKGVQESLRNVVMILWNVVRFYEMYATGESKVESRKLKVEDSENVLDKWILARLNQLIEEVTENMNNYNLPKAARPIEDFINDLSTWYIRRSRDRFKGDDEADKKSALKTTGYVLLQLSKVMAPFTPFVAENVWQKVTGNDFKNTDASVHLSGWPKTQITDQKVLDKMESARRAVKLGLSARDLANVKVKQPLSLLLLDIEGMDFNNSIIDNELLELIKAEVNVKEIQKMGDFKNKSVKRNRIGVIPMIDQKGVKENFSWDKENNNSVGLLIDLTPELKMEGVKRELVRFINALRKQAGMTIQDRAVVYYETASVDVKNVFEKMGDEILKDTLSNEIVDNISEAEVKKEVKVNGEEVVLGVKKI